MILNVWVEQYEYIKERQSQELGGTTVTPVLTLESRVVEDESESGPCCSHSTEVKSEENPTSVSEGIGSCCAAKTHSSNLPKGMCYILSLDCLEPCFFLVS